MPKIDPKVVMDLAIFKIGGWNSLQPSNQKMLEEFIDKNEPWFLIGIPSRDPFLVQKLKQMLPLLHMYLVRQDPGLRSNRHHWLKLFSAKPSVLQSRLS